MDFFLPTLVSVLLFVAFIAWCIVPSEYRRAVWFFALFIPFHFVLSDALNTYAFMAWSGGKTGGSNLSGIDAVTMAAGFVLNLPLTSLLLPFEGYIHDDGVVKRIGPWIMLVNSVLFTMIFYVLHRFWKRRALPPA